MEINQGQDCVCLQRYELEQSEGSKFNDLKIKNLLADTTVLAIEKRFKTSPIGYPLISYRSKQFSKHWALNEATSPFFCRLLFDIVQDKETSHM